MAIKGYNFYIKPLGDPGDYVKANNALSPTPTWTFTGLASDTEWDVRATAVDFAGLESPLSAVLDPAPKTAEYVPGSEPLPTADQDAIDAIVAASMAASGQPGVALEVTGPAGFYRKAYGNTAASGGRPVTLDDHWRVGSNTKMFVAMAVLQQVDAGLLSLTDTVDQWYPHPQVAGAENVTIQHMLTMMSGIPEFWKSFYIQALLGFNPTAGFTEEDAIRYSTYKAARFAPGSKFEYSNSNAVLLGGVLRQITGRRVKNIVLEDIVQPLGMHETAWPSIVTLQQPAMSGSQINPEIAGAAGAMTSTTGDMTKWAKALYERPTSLLSTEMWDWWTSTWPTVGGTPPIPQGYGGFLMSYGRWVGHGGSIPTGFDSAILANTDTGATIVVANNTQTKPQDAFYRIARDIALHLDPESMTVLAGT